MLWRIWNSPDCLTAFHRPFSQSDPSVCYYSVTAVSEFCRSWFETKTAHSIICYLLIFTCNDSTYFPWTKSKDHKDHDLYCLSESYFPPGIRVDKYVTWLALILWTWLTWYVMPTIDTNTHIYKILMELMTATKSKNYEYFREMRLRESLIIKLSKSLRLDTYSRHQR